MSNLETLRAQLKTAASPVKAAASARFFKTGPGQYGENDVFLGVTVPEQRVVARAHAKLPLADVERLLRSPVHEERLTALFILVSQFQRGDEQAKRAIYDLYLANTKNINNWDLVDSSAGYIVGSWLDGRDKQVLTKLAQSTDLWERRIAILATFYGIKNGDPADALKIAEILVHDPHDLIQKAVGWMLREIGKRCSTSAEEEFLAKHYKTMPRTMLRYAIERMPKAQRDRYLNGLM